MSKRSKAEVEEAAIALRAHLAHIQETHGRRSIYGLVRHVSKSRMLKQIQLFVIVDCELLDITFHASCLTGWGIGRSGGVRVRGTGGVYYLVNAMLHALHALQDGSSGVRTEWQQQFRTKVI